VGICGLSPTSPFAWFFRAQCGRGLTRPFFEGSEPPLLRGDLALVETPITHHLLEVPYIEKSGNVIYRMELSGLTHPEVVKRFR
jgi:hypothetical protein